MDSFTKAYIECALWSTLDETNAQGGEPLDANYCADDIYPQTLLEMFQDCHDFQNSNMHLIAQANEVNGYTLEQAGHDFWLTRNRHGAGFWDRGLDKIGEALTNAAHAYGSSDLYVGDDGKIYA